MIVRGTDWQAIFRDDVDRRAFRERFSALLVETGHMVETGTQCLAEPLPATVPPNH